MPNGNELRASVSLSEGSGEVRNSYYPSGATEPDPDVLLAASVYGMPSGGEGGTSIQADVVLRKDPTDGSLSIEVPGYVTVAEKDAAVDAVSTPDEKKLPDELTKVSDDGDIVRFQNAAGFWIEYRRSTQETRNAAAAAWVGTNDLA